MKTIIKWYFILKFTFFFTLGTFITIQKSIVNSNLNEIKNATILIQGRYHIGSGLGIEYKGKKFILTNAHVCLEGDDRSDLLFYKKFKRDLEYKDYAFNFLSDVATVHGVRGYYKDVFYNVDSDLCLIPASRMTRHMVFKKIDKERPSYYEYFLPENENVVIHSTRNMLDEATIFYGKFIGYNFGYTDQCNDSVEDRLKNDWCEKSYIKMSKDKYISNKIVQGDSGSGIFNSFFELTNVVHSNHVNITALSKKTNGFKDSIYRHEYEKTVHKGMTTTKKDLYDFLNKGVKFYEKNRRKISSL